MIEIRCSNVLSKFVNGDKVMSQCNRLVGLVKGEYSIRCKCGHVNKGTT